LTGLTRKAIVQHPMSRSRPSQSSVTLLPLSPITPAPTIMNRNSAIATSHLTPFCLFTEQRPK